MPGQAALPAHWQPYTVRSGNLVNPTPVAGVAVWQHVISLPPAVPWLRVHFSRAHLGKGSFVRITSMQDGDQQTLHQEHLEQWSFGTAYFNGHAVLLEVIAGPNTVKNMVEVEKIWAGDPPLATPTPTQICGTTDDRMPSSNPAVGRLVSSSGVCTAFIINEPTTGTDRGHLTAGHCSIGGAVLQFNVPASLANCTLVHPPAAAQFPVDSTRMVSNAGGQGDDYGVFRCFPNSNTNLTTFQQQNSAITLAPGAPANGSPLLVTGYGADGTNVNNAAGGDASCTCTSSNNTGQRHLVQQTGVGSLYNSGTNTAQYQDIDACTGASGGPVVFVGTGQAIAIHTHGGCATTLRYNLGTLTTHSGLRAAIHLVCHAPSNNECDHAVPVFDGVNGAFTTAYATTSGPAFPCQPATSNDVWFSYVATCNGTVTIDTCGATRNFDTVLQVLTDVSCTNFASVVCNDDTPGCGGDGLGSRVSFVASTNSRYLVRVGGYNGATGQFSLAITGCNAFNECAGAVPLNRGVNGPFTNAAATTSLPPWPCGGGAAGNDVWFRYDVSCAAAVTFSTCSTTTNFDTVLQVFTGTCGGLTTAGCNDNDGNCAESLRASRVSVTTSSAATLLARVGGYGGARGAFTIAVHTVPSNNECAGAITVQSGVNGLFCTNGATFSSPDWPCGVLGPDVWFRYTADCTGLLVADTCSARRTFDTKLEVFSGACGALTSLACNDDACMAGSSVSVPVVANQTYFLRVGAEEFTGNFDLTLRCTPPNNECAAAVTLTTGLSGPFTNVGATTSAPAWPCARGRAAADVWFRYVATCTAPHVFRTCSRARPLSTTLEVFSGSCGLLSSLGCDSGACSPGSSVSVELTATRTYYVRVGGLDGAQGPFDLEVMPGTGTGGLSRLTTGCGATTITATGTPNLLGSVHVQLGGLVGVPVLAIGFTLLNAPICPPATCRLGPNPQVVLPANGITLTVPCNPFLIGASLYLQGVDLGAAGGCAGQGTFTDTIVLTIG